MIDLDGLYENLKKGKMEKSYILVGLDELLIKEGIENIIDNVLDEGFKDLNLIRLDGNNLNFDDFMNACETLPFMSDKKVVVLNRTNIFRDKQDKETEKLYKQCVEYFQNTPEHCVLIAYTTLKDKRDRVNRLSKLKKLEKSSCIVSVEKLKGAKLQQKVGRIFQRYNKNIGKIELKYFCDSVENNFDVIERETTPWEGWQNPSNCQKQTNFVDVNDGKVGLMIANMGLPEYEVLRDGENTIALTILRSVGELGDWGVFPTPEAQCLGKNVAEYSIVAHEGDYTGERAYEEAYNLNTPMLALQGDFKAEDSLVSIKGENVVLSAFKKAEEGDSIIVRIFNISDKEENFQIKVNRDVKEINEVNLNEELIEKLEVKENAINGIISKKQIKTFEIVL